MKTFVSGEISILAFFKWKQELIKVDPVVKPKVWYYQAYGVYVSRWKRNENFRRS